MEGRQRRISFGFSGKQQVVHVCEEACGAREAEVRWGGMGVGGEETGERATGED